LARCAARFTSGSLIRPFPNDPEKVFQVNALSVEGWVEQLLINYKHDTTGTL
jgi:hypothetical protein